MIFKVNDNGTIKFFDVARASDIPSITAAQVAGGATVTIVDGDGTHIVNLYDGEKPVKGTDYWTASDQESIISAIRAVLTVEIDDASPSITAEPNTTYVCGEVLSLNFTPCPIGTCEVIFTAGSTLPVVTLPATVMMPEWYEIKTGRIYEISITDGIYGAVMSWPQS